MKNIRNKNDHQEILERINGLRAGSERQWGVMTADQMVYHLNRVMGYIMGEYAIPDNSNFIKRLLLKPIVLGKMPFPKGKADAVPEFIGRDKYDLESEKKRFSGYMERYAVLAEQEFPKSPVLGRFTAEEWGRLDYKHMDHHLRQFGL